MTFYRFARAVVLERVQGGVPGAGRRQGARARAPARTSSRRRTGRSSTCPFAAYVTDAHDPLPGQGRAVRQPARPAALRRARRGAGRARHRRPRRACARSKAALAAGRAGRDVPRGHAPTRVPRSRDAVRGAAYLAREARRADRAGGHRRAASTSSPKGKVAPAHPPGRGVGRASRSTRRCSRAGRAASAAKRAHRAAADVELQRCFDDAERLRSTRSGSSRRGRRARVGGVDARGRRRTSRRRAAAAAGRSPPKHRRASDVERRHAARAARAGGGKYSSSSVTWTSSTPRSGARRAMTACDEVLGRAGAGGDARRSRASPSASRSSSSGPSMRSTIGQPAVRGHLRQRERVRRVGAADHHDGVGPAAIAGERGLAVGGGEAEVVAGRGPQVGELAAGPVGDALPVVRGRGWSGRGARPSSGRRPWASTRRRRPRARRAGSASGATASVPTASSWPAWPT